MNNEVINTDDYKNLEPWIVVDSFSKREWVLPQPLRYYVCQDTDGAWFICDRFQDSVVHGTEAKSRADAIRQFFKWCNREMPVGMAVPRAPAGVSHHGEGG